MKIVTIIGARPQFIKAAALSRRLRVGHHEVLVNTGQHYDGNMTRIFFDELDIPEPDYNLGIGSGRHGAQTGSMLSSIEGVLVKEQPDRIMVYGDTNSTLAGALAAVKLHIPVAHVEAGLRSYNRRMPEEINRVLTDHVSDLLFCPSSKAVANLKREGIVEGVHMVGDVMYEALMHATAKSRQAEKVVGDLDIEEKGYWLVTVHRAENTDDPGRLRSILKALTELSKDAPVIFPVHPRTRAALNGLEEELTRVKCIEPVGYADMAWLLSRARGVLTDSGGMQKEAYWLRVPCVTLRDETEWMETVESGWNVLAGADWKRIVSCALTGRTPAITEDAYGGTGSVARLIKALG